MPFNELLYNGIPKHTQLTLAYKIEYYWKLWFKIALRERCILLFIILWVILFYDLHADVVLIPWSLVEMLSKQESAQKFLLFPIWETLHQMCTYNNFLDRITVADSLIQIHM